MTVRDAAFADRPGAEGDAISRSIGLPLNAVIDLLEDPDGTIDLVIPFEGDLLSPDFDLSQVFWTGFVRVLRALVPAPFKLVSASVSLLSATDGKGDSGSASPFTIDPILFRPGTAALDPGAPERIRSVAQVLQDRPRLRLKICAVASGADRPAGVAPAAPGTAPPLSPEQAAVMTRLALERMDAITRELMSSRNIAGDRVQRCPEPRIDIADTGPPRVEVRF